MAGVSAHRTSRRTFLAGASALALVRQSFSRGLERSDVGREAYDLDESVTYLNHASIGTIPRSVREAHARYLEVCETNPWLYVWGGAWSEAFDEAHAAAAGVLGVTEDRVAVIRNTTAAFGMAANGLPLGAGHEVLFSSLNHTGASASWTSAAEARGFTVRRFEFPEDDVPSLSREDVTRAHLDAIRDETEVMVLPHIDNVFGVRHDIGAIARGARERGVRWVLADGAQSIGMHEVDVDASGVDVYATSAHKWLQAPKGTGLMALSDAALGAMRPMVTSWGKGRWEGTARAFTDFGTRDLAKVLALGDAIAFHARTGAGREAHYADLRGALLARIEDDARLELRSPRTYADGGSLVAVGLRKGTARFAASALFERHGVVVRGFERDGRHHLRVSPNRSEGPKDLDRFVAALDDVLG
ncbi:MAG: aminotransferase class V-fold PLP-dependent enzyme [Planctomycetota bacterium]